MNSSLESTHFMDVFYVICVGYLSDLLKFGFLVNDTQLSSRRQGDTLPAPTTRLMLCREIKGCLCGNLMKCTVLANCTE